MPTSQNTVFSGIMISMPKILPRIGCLSELFIATGTSVIQRPSIAAPMLVYDIQVIAESHNGPIGGHRGYPKTYKLVVTFLVDGHEESY